MKKIAMLIVALVVVLAGLGVGYAYWTQNLQVNVNTTQGTLKADIVNNVDPAADHNGASVSSQISGSPVANTLTITASNLYPGYDGTVNFQIKNDGTIPFYVHPDSATWQITGFSAASYIEVGMPEGVAPFPWHSWDPTAVCNQGGTLNCAAHIHVDSGETANQGQSYSHTFAFSAEQFNRPIVGPGNNTGN